MVLEESQICQYIIFFFLILWTDRMLKLKTTMTSLIKIMDEMDKILFTLIDLCVLLQKSPFLLAIAYK